MADKQAYNISEVAQMLGISKTTVREMIYQSKIPWLPVGERRKVIPKKAFEEWVQRKTRASS